MRRCMELAFNLTACQLSFCCSSIPVGVVFRMASSRRLQKELSDLKSCGVKAYESVEYDESNLLHWTVLLVPDKEPYNKGAFKVNIDFPADYPFKPPKITLATKIYHPNIDDKGQVCLPIVDPNNWKPATRTEQGNRFP
ncbi:unnamed protein product [Strongylus vulgaris]|uniref:E2 ubiquitin-conjugating enzyme n=1 Tax=Strongylus vulgaris TaxID=40348 RepID=A0A3P7IMX6_STRVU|nr:unnamed protein product [Strongylus vulgaris]